MWLTHDIGTGSLQCLSIQLSTLMVPEFQCTILETVDRSYAHDF